MRASLLCVLALTSSVMSYSVTVPNSSQGWTNSGAQPLTWQRVDTDPQNFTAVLVNSASGYVQVLDALVDGSLLNTTVNTPSAGWPFGPGFRVNLVKDTQDLNTILAQSDVFKISLPASASSTIPGVTSSISSGQTTIPAVITPTTTGVSTTATLAPAKGNGAFGHVQAHVGLWGGALGLLGFFLA